MKIEKVLLYWNYALFLQVAEGFGKTLKQKKRLLSNGEIAKLNNNDERKFYQSVVILLYKVNKMSYSCCGLISEALINQ